MSAGIDPRQIADRLWPVLRQSIKGHTVVYRATHGLVGHRLPGAPPMLLLDHVGAKSGKRRTTPPPTCASGEKLSSSRPRAGIQRTRRGSTILRANPDTTVQVGSQRRPVRARVAMPASAQRAMAVIVDLYGGYRDYQERTDR